MSWTPHEAFKIKLREQIVAMKTITDQNVFIETIVNQVRAPDEDGFERLQMSNMQYLIADIDLPWWAYIISSLIILILYAPLLWWFFRNDEGEPLERPSRWGSISSYSRFKHY